MKIDYCYTEKFKRDLKKFPTLKNDLKTVQKNAIELKHNHHIDNRAIFEIPNYNTENIKIYKLKKFACKSLKGRGVKTGIRVIYAHNILENKITLLEIYFKGNKENEDSERIKQYLNDLNEH